MKILIIGGGTTGWWAAGYLEHVFPEYDITLVESETIPKIGVGESTLPQIKNFFESLGIHEDDWLTRCNGIKKDANVKQGWDNPNGSDFPFTFWQDWDNTFPSWIKKYSTGTASIDEWQTFNKAEDGTYAYHIDAELAGAVVKNNCKRVKHIVQTLDKLPDGYDFYLDCTGFRRQFIKDKELITNELHQVDRAVVCGYELTEQDKIGRTRSIARPYGWQFVIDIATRVGTGYVYSSKYLSDEQAIEDFKSFNSHRVPYKGLTPRIIKLQAGWLKRPWQDNIIGIGLSGGFIDPLESNALYMTQYSITLLAQCLKRWGNTELARKAYNRSMRREWKINSDYILHHYILAGRDDTDFWKYYKPYKNDAKKSLWKNYNKNQDVWTTLYPKALWATVGTYYKEFDHIDLITGPTL